MSLYDPERRRERTRSISPEQAASAVHAFLARVQAYADERVGRAEAAGSAPSRADWEAFARLNRVTLREVEDGTLDDWFREIAERGE